ncbi:hypothetical protein VTN96DRAFT_7226 [Rasamsonia emersonii]
MGDRTIAGGENRTLQTTKSKLAGRAFSALRVCGRTLCRRTNQTPGMPALHRAVGGTRAFPAGDATASARELGRRWDDGRHGGNCTLGLSRIVGVLSVFYADFLLDVSCNWPVGRLISQIEMGTVPKNPDSTA